MMRASTAAVALAIILQSQSTLGWSPGHVQQLIHTLYRPQTHSCAACCGRRSQQQRQAATGGKGGGKASAGRGGGSRKAPDTDMAKAVRTLEVMEARKEAKKERKTVQKADKAERFAAASRQGKGIRANPLRPRRTDEELLADVDSGNRKKGVPVNPFQTSAPPAGIKFSQSDIKSVNFVGSYAEDESAWPASPLPEIAFLGRSNVGKSSMLNCLFGQQAAKVSKTPGRTQLINIFAAKGAGGKEICRFTDLPGYGFAKIAKEDQRSIEGFLMQYLKHRQQLKLLVLLVDSRRDPQEMDASILDFAAEEGVDYKVVVVATKTDKLSAAVCDLNLHTLREGLELPDELPLAFSSVTGKGKKELWAYIKEACEA